MSESFVEDDDTLQFYTAVRTALGDLLYTGYGVDEEATRTILSSLDHLVAERTQRIVVSDDPDAGENASAFADEVNPAMQAPALETGIFNLVVTLCLRHGETMPAPEARERVVEYLLSIVSGLRQVNEESEQPQPKENS